MNFGKVYAINESGAFNEFVIQKLTKSSTGPKLLGMDMTQRRLDSYHVTISTNEIASFYHCLCEDF